jgi:hypothetical protein
MFINPEKTSEEKSQGPANNRDLQEDSSDNTAGEESASIPKTEESVKTLEAISAELDEKKGEVKSEEVAEEQKGTSQDDFEWYAGDWRKVRYLNYSSL